MPVWAWRFKSSPGHQNSLDILIKLSETRALGFALDHFWDRFWDRFVEFGVLNVRFGWVFALDCGEDCENSTYHE